MAPEEYKNYEHQSPIPPPLAGDFQSTGNVVRTDKTLIVKGFFVADDREVQMLRGQRFNRKAVTGNYTAAVVDYLLGVTSLAVAANIGLPKPSIAGVGKTFTVKDEAGGAGTTTITVRSDAEANIDGAATSTLSTNYQSKDFYTDGSNWYTK